MLSDFEIAALSLSLKVAFMAVLIGFPLSLLLAHLLTRPRFTGQFSINILVHIPLVVPPVVVGYALLIFLAPNSTFGSWLSSLGLNPSFTWGAAAIASMIMALPLMVRAVMQAYETIPNAYIEVAATLGANPLRQYMGIILPLISPGIRTALILGFARAIGEFGATITFAANIPGLTRTLPLALYTASQSPGAETEAIRFAVLCLVPAVMSLALSEYFTRKSKTNSR